MSDRPFLTTGQVAERIGLCERSVRRGIVRGEIPGYRVGKRYLVPALAFDEYLHGRWIPQTKASAPVLSMVKTRRSA
jgi:excisionase family DNA binding protein